MKSFFNEYLNEEEPKNKSIASLVKLKQLLDNQYSYFKIECESALEKYCHGGLNRDDYDEPTLIKLSQYYDFIQKTLKEWLVQNQKEAENENFAVKSYIDSLLLECKKLCRHSVPQVLYDFCVDKVKGCKTINSGITDMIYPSIETLLGIKNYYQAFVYKKEDTLIEAREQIKCAARKIKLDYKDEERAVKFSEKVATAVVAIGDDDVYSLAEILNDESESE